MDGAIHGHLPVTRWIAPARRRGDQMRRASRCAHDLLGCHAPMGEPPVGTCGGCPGEDRRENLCKGGGSGPPGPNNDVDVSSLGHSELPRFGTKHSRHRHACARTQTTQVAAGRSAFLISSVCRPLSLAPKQTGCLRPTPAIFGRSNQPQARVPTLDSGPLRQGSPTSRVRPQPSRPVLPGWRAGPAGRAGAACWPVLPAGASASCRGCGCAGRPPAPAHRSRAPTPSPPRARAGAGRPGCAAPRRGRLDPRSSRPTASRSWLAVSLMDTRMSAWLSTSLCSTAGRWVISHGTKPRTRPRRTTSSTRPSSSCPSDGTRCGAHRSASSRMRCSGSVFASYSAAVNVVMKARRAAAMPRSDTSTTQASGRVPTSRPRAAPIPGSSATSACRPPNTTTG